MSLRQLAVGLMAGGLIVVGSGFGAVGTAGAALPAAGETQLLSVSDSSPAQAGDENSQDPSMSSDGRYVVFSSSSTNIGRLGTTSHRSQVYLRDVEAGVTTVVSAAGGVPGNGDSDRAVISGDGSMVAFISTATNLIASSRSDSTAQVLRWSRATGAFTHVSMSNDPVPNAANGRAIGVAISGDGMRIAFSSNATNLVGQATSGVFQVFSRDVAAGTTSLVSVDTRSMTIGSLTDAAFPSISDDGRIIGFASAGRLTDMDTFGKYQVYARDMTTATTEVVSLDTSGTRAGGADSFYSSLSSDGRLIAFSSEARSLSPERVDGTTQAYVRDRQTKVTELVSVDVANRIGANASSYLPVISGDGRAIAFLTRATNLVPQTGGLEPGTIAQAVIRDLANERTILVCRPRDGVGLCFDSVARAVTRDGRRVAMVSSDYNLAGGEESTRSQVYLRDMTELPRVERIGGADRYAVSSGVATDAFGTGVPVAFVASGAGFADALAGSAAAGAERGPVLLVRKDSIPTLVGIELHRLEPRKIVVLGGEASIDPTVQAALAAYSPVVERVSGADRYEVSAALSKTYFGDAGDSGGEHPAVFVASGSVFPDALSGSAAAGRAGAPVLLVTKTGVPGSVLAELKRLEPRSITVLGGRNTIADDVVKALGEVAPTARIDGADRYAVSAAVSSQSRPEGAHTVYVASGAVFPDALSGSAAAIQNRAPVLLVAAGQIPAKVGAELDRLNPTRIVVLGGEATVSPAVLQQLEAYLEPAA